MPSFSKIKRKILIAGEISLDVSSHACNLEFDKLSSFSRYKNPKRWHAPLQTIFPNKEVVISKTPQNNFQRQLQFLRILFKTKFSRTFAHRKWVSP